MLEAIICVSYAYIKATSHRMHHSLTVTTFCSAQVFRSIENISHDRSKNMHSTTLQVYTVDT